MGVTQATTMTVDRLLARLAWLEGERARLHREYERLGDELHARLQGADHVVADGYPRCPAPWAAPAELGGDYRSTYR